MKVVWKFVVLVIVAGACLGLVSGFVENNMFRGVAIPEKRFYGFPLVWRSFDPFIGEDYYFFELLADVVFWIVVVAVVALVVRKLIGRS